MSYIEADKQFQIWLSDMKAQPMMNEKQSLKGLRHDNFQEKQELIICS